MQESKCSFSFQEGNVENNIEVAIQLVMVNGLNPLMASRACANPCSISNLYRRLNKILLRLRDENVSRLIIEGRSSHEINSENSKSTRRTLFCSPVIQKTRSMSSVSTLSSSLVSQKSSRSIFNNLLSPITVDHGSLKNNIDLSWWDKKLETYLRESFEISERMLNIENNESKLRPKKKINSCRSSSKLVNSLNKQKLDNKNYYDVRFKERLKLATIEFQSSTSKRNNGSNGSPPLSLNEIISKHNFFLSPSAPRILTKSTVHRYVNKGLAGLSPIRSGPSNKIPLLFQKVMALHCRMIHNSIGM